MNESSKSRRTALAVVRPSGSLGRPPGARLAARREPFAGAGPPGGGTSSRRDARAVHPPPPRREGRRPGALHLEQLETLSDPAQPHRWELARHLGLVPSDLDPAVPEDTAWHPSRPPRMAFDHEAIALAGRTACARLSYTSRLRARGGSRSRSSATSTPPRSGTTSPPRTSSACSCAAACSSGQARSAPAGTGGGRRGGALPLPVAPPRDHGPVRGAQAAAGNVTRRSTERSPVKRIALTLLWSSAPHSPSR